MASRPRSAVATLIAAAVVLLVPGLGCRHDESVEHATPVGTTNVGTVPETPPATAPPTTRPPRPKPAQLVTVYGAAGSFGALDGSTPTAPAPASIGPRGPLADTGPVPQPVAGFAFEPGASAAMAAVTDRGRVVIGTFPQSDSQVESTMASMSIGVLDPVAATFASLRVPTTTGEVETTGPTGRTAGADVSDVCASTTPGGPRVLGVSMMPYRGVPAHGSYPTLVSLVDTGEGSVTIDPEGTRTAAELRATDAGRRTIPSTDDSDPLAANAQGFNECEAAPNGDVFITQYLPNGSRSGGVVAFDPGRGVITAGFTVEALTLQSDVTVRTQAGALVRVRAGTTPIVSPREVRVDPHHTDPRDQRLIVVSDLAVPGAEVGSASAVVALPNVFQELSYDAVAGTFTARTGTLVLRDAVPGGAPNDIVRGETVTYAPDGTLFVAQTHAESLFAAPMAVFAPDSLSGRPTEPAVVGSFVTPDRVIDAFDVDGIPAAPAAPVATSAFSLTYDDERDLVLSVGINGVLRALHWAPENGPVATTPGGRGCQVDLGGTVLADAHRPFTYQARAGAIDHERGMYYVPFQSVRPSTSRIPDGTPAPQFVFGIDLDRLAAACRS